MSFKAERSRLVHGHEGDLTLEMDSKQVPVSYSKQTSNCANHQVVIRSRKSLTLIMPLRGDRGRKEGAGGSPPCLQSRQINSWRS